MRLLGLVLSGGRSSRMGRDKGELVYPPSRMNQRARCSALLETACAQVHISCREEQRNQFKLRLPLILDSHAGEGPGVGILSAADLYPGHPWLVLACDFPFIDEEDIGHLVRQRSPDHDATSYVHRDGTLEPLFAIWEPAALQALATSFSAHQFSPRSVLSSLHCRRIEPRRDSTLRNVNSRQERDRAFPDPAQNLRGGGGVGQGG